MSGTTTTLSPTAEAAYPYNSIVEITDTINGIDYQSTGVLISKDEVLTADNAVYKPGSSGGLAGNVIATLTANDPATLQPVATNYLGTVTHFTSLADDPTISLSDVASDYAVIHLSQPVVDGAAMVVSATGAGSHVTGFPASAGGALVDATTPYSSTNGYSVLQGPSLGAGSSGSPIWSTGSDRTPDVIGIVSSASGGTAYGADFTTSDVQKIAGWVAADDGTAPPPALDPNNPANQPTTPPVPGPNSLPATTQITPLTAVVPQPGGNGPPTGGSPSDYHTPTSSAIAAFTETVNGAPGNQHGALYSGPVSGLYYALIDLTPGNINVVTHSPGCFIHTGSGTDAIQASSGTNVLDGGTGSNFLTGGTGTDTFFVDARGATADTWSTVANFHSGDAATLWGVSAATPAQWAADQGAAGYTGLTLHAGASGGPTASITLAGFGAADLTNGKITASFGTDQASGSSYLYLHAT